MATLIVDIETVGESWTELDEVTQAVLSRWIDKTAVSPADRTLQLEALQNELGFSPLTGFIVAIGVYDLERAHGAVYYTGTGTEIDIRDEDFIFKQRSEQQMLEDFWEGARSYDTFVTYNGRSFDIPFLLHRSVAQGVKPTCDLMRGRYLYQQRETRHIDLADQLTFYGAMRRRPSLHLFCRAYGIESPKAEGVSGDDVATLYKQQQFETIARYNARDVVATTKLYEKWREYLAFTEHGANIDF